MSNRWTRRGLLAAAAAAPIGVVLATRDRTPLPRHLPGGGHADRYFPNVALTTHRGEQVRLYDDLLRDRFVVVNFMYSVCDGICTGVTSTLRRVQKLLGDRVGDDIFMYSFTLKPSEDTPEVLREYARRFEVGPGWTFLTGSPREMESLRRRLGFTDSDPALDRVPSQHTGMIRFGDVPHQRWAACPGQVRAESIAHSILSIAQSPRRAPRPA